MLSFTIPCGDWIFPARDTSTAAAYPIDYPLVMDIFRYADEPMEKSWRINAHLKGPRALRVNILDVSTLRIDTLINEHKPLFARKIGFQMEFDVRELARLHLLWPKGVMQAVDGSLIPDFDLLYPSD